MPQNAVELCKDLAPVVAGERDSQKIIDLIEQLELDLVETRKNASKRR